MHNVLPCVGHKWRINTAALKFRDPLGSTQHTPSNFNRQTTSPEYPQLWWLSLVMPGRQASAFWSNQLQNECEANSCVRAIGKIGSEQRGRSISLGHLPLEWTLSFNGMYKYFIHYFVLQSSNNLYVWPITLKSALMSPFNGVSSNRLLPLFNEPRGTGTLSRIYVCSVKHQSISKYKLIYFHFAEVYFPLRAAAVRHIFCFVFPFTYDICEGQYGFWKTWREDVIGPCTSTSDTWREPWEEWVARPAEGRWEEGSRCETTGRTWGSPVCVTNPFTVPQLGPRFQGQEMNSLNMASLNCSLLSLKIIRKQTPDFNWIWIIYD